MGFGFLWAWGVSGDGLFFGLKLLLDPDVFCNGLGLVEILQGPFLYNLKA